MSGDGYDGESFLFDPGDIIYLLELITAKPSVITISQLRGVVESVSAFQRRSESPTKMTLRETEKILKQNDLTYLPIGSFAYVVDLCTQLNIGRQTAEKTFDNIPVSNLAKISARRFAGLSVDDVVSLAKLGNKVKGAKDVLEAVELDEVRNSLSKSALWAVKVEELRRVLEQLSSL